MADPLSLTGTAIGIVSLGLQVSTGLVLYYNQYQAYEDDVKGTLEMIERLRETFALLDGTLNSDLIKTHPAASQALKGICSCKDGISNLEKMLMKIKTKEPIPGAKSIDRIVANVRKQGTRMLYPFKQGTLGKLRDNVSELRDQFTPVLMALNLEVSVNVVQEVRALRLEHQAWHNDEETEIILNWISPLDFHSRQQALLSLKSPGTVEWFLQSAVFESWQNSASGAPTGLWCHGSVGSGKSVFASSVVEHLSKVFDTTDTAILYLYCDWQDSESQSLSNMIGSLIKQLAESCEKLPLGIKDSYIKHKRGKSQMTIFEILTLLFGVMEFFKRVFIVVDGLDECDYGEDKTHGSKSVRIENELGKILKQSTLSTQSVGVLVTSRFQPRSTTINFTLVEYTAHPNDLLSFLKTSIIGDDFDSTWTNPRLGDKVKCDLILQEQIIQRCLSQTDNMFLLAKLHVLHLKQQVNARQLQKALAGLNSSLKETIDECIARVYGQNSATRELGLRVLLWVAYSLRPLNLIEIQHALAVEYGDEEFEDGGISPVEILLSSCAGLVSIDSGNGVVRFINSSIKEHLETLNPPLHEEPHLEILRVCSTYLQLKEFDLLLGPRTDMHERYRGDYRSYQAQKNRENIQTWLSKYPFLGYAARHWAAHAKHGTQADAADIIASLLGNDIVANFLYFVLFATHWPDLTAACAFDVSGLHLAALFDLQPIAVELLTYLNQSPEPRHGKPVVLGDSSERTPLYLAAGQGNIDMVQILLQNGMGVSGRGGGANCHDHTVRWWLPSWARNEYFSQAIEAAAEGGHRDTVLLLLGHGALLGTAHSTGGVFGGPLEAAVFKGHIDIVRDLLATNPEIQPTVIQAAVYAGNAEVLEILLKSISRQEDTVISRSASNSSASSIDEYSLPSRARESFDSMVGYALYAAALSNKLELVITLIVYGADVNKETKGFHRTALIAAAAHGNLEIIKLLVEKGAQVNKYVPLEKPPRTKNYYVRFPGNDEPKNPGNHASALQAAAYTGKIATVELLLELGADVNIPGGYYGTALQAAAISEKLELVKLLLDRGANVNSQSGLYNTPLQAAAFFGSTPLLHMLLKVGADVNAVGGQYTTPLIAATKNGNVGNVMILIEAGADLNITSRRVGTALYVASSNIEVGSGDRLSMQSAMPWRSELKPTSELNDFVKFGQNRGGFACMQNAAVFGWYTSNAAKELFLDGEPGQDAATGPFDWLHAISVSQEENSLVKFMECLKALLSHGADPNIEGGRFSTPLIAASIRGNLDAVKSLVRAGARIDTILAKDPIPDGNDLNIKDDSDSESAATPPKPNPQGTTYESPYFGTGRSALGSAVIANHVAVVDFLLENGCDPNEKSLEGGNTLLHACSNVDIADLLIKKGAVVDARNDWESTPLNLAQPAYRTCPKVLSSTPGIMDILVKAGADVNSSNKTGQTPLHLAVNHNRDNLSGVSVLLAAGANVNAENNKGETPLDLTYISDSDAVADRMILLLNAGATKASQARLWTRVVAQSDDWPPIPPIKVAQWLVNDGIDVNAGSTISLADEDAEFLSLAQRNTERAKEPKTQGVDHTPNYFRDHSDARRVRDCNPILKLAANGPEEPERLEMLIRNRVDLKRFGKTALLLAIRNKKDVFGMILLRHGVRASEIEVRSAFFKRMLRAPWPKCEDLFEQFEEEFAARREWREILHAATQTSP